MDGLSLTEERRLDGAWGEVGGSSLVLGILGILRILSILNT